MLYVVAWLAVAVIFILCGHQARSNFLIGLGAIMVLMVAMVNDIAM